MHPLLDTTFEQCTKCTICTEYCPLSAFNHTFPGPKQSGPDGERLRLKSPAAYDDALKYCLNCKRCEVACPSGVRIGDVIQLARKKYERRKLSLRDALLGHTDFMGGMAAGPMAPVLNAVAASKPIKALLEAGLGIPGKRRFPRYATEPFRRWFTRKAEQAQGVFQEQTALFHGCYVNYNNPALGRDIVAVFNAMGIGVRLLPQEKCCGVPLIAGGFFSHAARNARLNAASIASMLRRDIDVVVTSSTCFMTLRDEYPHILEVDNSVWRERIDLVARHIHRLLENGKTLRLRPIRLKAAYHTACHMERLGWGSYSIDLLRRIPALDLRILPSQCCGIAGTYGFKMENYAAAQKIGASLFRDIEESGADIIITDCETCKMQIEMSTGKVCEHPVTMLARALESPAW